MSKKASGQRAAARWLNFSGDVCTCAECNVGRAAAIERMKARGVVAGGKRAETMRRWAIAHAARAKATRAETVRE